MLLVVAMKSRTFSSFSYSANEHVCTSCKGAQPDRWPSWPMEIFHTIDIMLSLWKGLARGHGDFCSSRFCEFKSSPVWEFELFLEIWGFGVLRLLLRDWPQISLQVVRKIVLHIVCFAHSLLSLLLSIVVVVILILVCTLLFF